MKFLSPDLLSVLQVPLDDPAVLEEGIRSLVVSQIDALASITDNISCSGVRGRAIADQLLQVRDVVRRHWGESVSVVPG